MEQFVCPVDRCNCGSPSTISSHCTVPGVGARRGQVDHSAAAGGAQLPEQLPGHQRGPGQVHLSKNLIIGIFFFGKFAIFCFILLLNIVDGRVSYLDLRLEHGGGLPLQPRQHQRGRVVHHAVQPGPGRGGQQRSAEVSRGHHHHFIILTTS